MGEPWKTMRDKHHFRVTTIEALATGLKRQEEILASRSRCGMQRSVEGTVLRGTVPRQPTGVRTRKVDMLDLHFL